MKIIKLFLITSLFISACGGSSPHPISHDARMVIDITTGSNTDYVELFKLVGSNYEAIGQMQLGGNHTSPSKYVYIDKSPILEHPYNANYKAVYHQYDGTSPSDINASFKVVIEDETGQTVSSNLGHLSEQVVTFVVK